MIDSFLPSLLFGFFYAVGFLIMNFNIHFVACYFFGTLMIYKSEPTTRKKCIFRFLFFSMMGFVLLSLAACFFMFFKKRLFDIYELTMCSTVIFWFLFYILKK